MNDNVRLTDAEKSVIRHALGWSTACAQRFAYRNYFQADPHSDDWHTWRGLLVKGLAREWSVRGLTYFAASQDAAEAARLEGEQFHDDILVQFKHAGFSEVPSHE